MTRSWWKSRELWIRCREPAVPTWWPRGILEALSITRSRCVAAIQEEVLARILDRRRTAGATPVTENHDAIATWLSSS